MRVPSSKRAPKGSQKWLQTLVNECLVNECPEMLLLPSGKLQSKPSDIQWLSPLQSDEYAEYGDQCAIDRLGIKLKRCQLEQFWPKRGPRWDGLAKTFDGKIILVEAKSRTKEMEGKGSKSQNQNSIQTIDDSLHKTRQFLNADSGAAAWIDSSYYQYANRLAHLYFLAELNGIDAYLMMIYFLNDKEQEGPRQISEWEEAIRKQNACLGLPNDHRLSDRVIPSYPDVAKIRDVVNGKRRKT